MHHQSKDQSHSPSRLPTESLLPFSTCRLSNPFVVINNRKGSSDSDDGLLKRYAWIVSSDFDISSVLLSESKFFFAERYGGVGISSHGGGARCGLDGEYQIKGIGKNVLAGQNVPLDYSHGGASLFEGLKEAIWGEVFHCALPYGAVRAPFVIATGTRCWWVVNRWGEQLLRERYGDDVYLPRGLIVREAAIRPAHFERAMFFKPSSDFAAQLTPDAARVRENIQVLHQLLPMPADVVCSDRLPPAERLRVGTFEMARRFAMQDAAAQAKRLIHGNISPSNICLDGRWIDFGSVTALPGWGDVVGYGSFWDSSDIYANIFANLCFNIRKYFSIKSEPLPQDDALLTEYKATHAHWLKKRFLGLTGWPFVLIDQVQHLPVAQRLYRALIAIAKAGHGVPYREPYKEQPDDESKFGAYRLGTILFELARWHGSSDCDAHIATLLDSTALRKDLLSAYANVFRAVNVAAEAVGVSSLALRRLMLINSAKSARSIRMLYVAHLVRECERIVLAHRDMRELRVVAEAFIGNLVNESRVVYGDPTGLTTVIWIAGGECLTYSATADRFYVRKDSERVESTGCEIDITHSTLSIVGQAKAYFGTELWEHLQ